MGIPVTFPAEPQPILDTLRKILRARGELRAAHLLEYGEPSFDDPDFDNLDGGTYYWRLRVSIRAEDFGRLTRDECATIVGHLNEAASAFADRYRGHRLNDVVIGPALATTDTLDLSALLARRGLILANQLGHGSYGEVYLARHATLGDARAVKVFSPSALVQSSRQKVLRALERFKREALVLARLRHPSVVRLFDAHLEGDVQFIVTEYCEGMTAKARVDEGALSFEEAVAVVKALLVALETVHANGVVHRDIAPKNVILSPSGSHKVMLIDFGLSGLLEAELQDRLTTTVVGTPGFFAPELVADPTANDPTLDVFSVAALFHYLLTGRPPHGDSTKLLQDRGIARHRTQAIAQGFASQRAARYGSVTEFLAALEALEPQSGKPVSRTARGATIEVGDVLHVLGVAGDNPQLVAIAERLRAALLSPPPPPYTEMAGAFIATLVCGARQLVEHSRGIEWNASWQPEAALVPSVAQLLALRGRKARADDAAARAALKAASGAGWLETEDYDAWHSGMPSGSGWTTRYLVTPLGKLALERAGIQATQ